MDDRGLDLSLLSPDECIECHLAGLDLEFALEECIGDPALRKRAWELVEPDLDDDPLYGEVHDEDDGEDDEDGATVAGEGGSSGDAPPRRVVSPSSVYLDADNGEWDGHNEELTSLVERLSVQVLAQKAERGVSRTFAQVCA